MTFFCAKCQRRHDVKGISADMWSICKEDVSVGLDKVSKTIQQRYDHEIAYELADFFDALIQFINEVDFLSVDTPIFKGETRVNSFFTLNPINLNALVDPVRTQNTVSGTYVIRLKQLISLFRNYSSMATPNLLGLLDKYVAPSWQEYSVCEKKIIFFLDKNGTFEKVTDPSNVPFEREGVNLGSIRLCPHCGRELSSASGRAEEIVVALAGSPRAGKTSCMVAMVNSLINGQLSGVKAVPDVQDRKWISLKSEIDNYQRCAKITKTPDKQTEVPSQSLLLQLQDKEMTKRVLTIVDMPGEFWQSGNGLASDFFSQYSGMYENIDCIWFVISKATVRLSQSAIPESVKGKLTGETSEDADVIQKANPFNLESNFDQLKRQLVAKVGRGLPPTMVIVSKPDFIVSDVDAEETRKYDLFPAEAGEISSSNADETARMIKHENGRFYGILEQKLFVHSANVRNFIKTINPALLSAIESNCTDRFYTSLSAYGRPASVNGTDATPTPYHELNPLLWTLSVTGACRIYHNCRWLKKNFLGSVVSREDTIESVRLDYRKKPDLSRLKPKQQQDVLTILQDVSDNILMHKETFTRTVIEHGRE